MATSNDKVFLDLEDMAISENPKWVRLLEVAHARAAVLDEEKRLKKMKGELTKEIEALFDQLDLDGAVAGEVIIETANSKSGGKWNSTKLFQLLTPDQLELVYTPGKPHSYIKASRDEKRAERLLS